MTLVKKVGFCITFLGICINLTYVKGKNQELSLDEMANCRSANRAKIRRAMTRLHWPFGVG